MLFLMLTLHVAGLLLALLPPQHWREGGSEASFFLRLAVSNLCPVPREIRPGQVCVSSPSHLVLRVHEAQEGVPGAVPLCLGLAALALPGSCGHCRHRLKRSAGRAGPQPLLQRA